MNVRLSSHAMTASATAPIALFMPSGIGWSNFRLRRHIIEHYARLVYVVKNVSGTHAELRSRQWSVRAAASTGLGQPEDRWLPRRPLPPPLPLATDSRANRRRVGDDFGGIRRRRGGGGQRRDVC